MAIDLYFAGSQCKEAEVIVAENALCRLHSYYNDRSKLNKRFEEHVPGKLFIDSGAFTAWTKGVSIDVDTYIDFLNTYADQITLAGQIDTIAGAPDRTATPEEQYQASVATWENYLYMYERLVKPQILVYTFHIGEDFSFLKQALEWRDSNGKPFQYMALGGTVGKPVKMKIEWFEKCWNIIKNSSNPNVKVHAFGMTSLKVLENFPFASADSTSWIMTGSNGGIFTKYGTIYASDTHKSDMDHYSHLPEDAKKAVVEEITSLGYPMEELETNYKARVCYNMLYQYKWSQNCNPVYRANKQRKLF